MSFPPGTEMFQFPGFACPYRAYTLRCGFPHSDIHGSTGARPSPQLFAACHVLLRLLAPRHPPNALILTLDRFSVLILAIRNFTRRSLSVLPMPREDTRFRRQKSGIRDQMGKTTCASILNSGPASWLSLSEISCIRPVRISMSQAQTKMAPTHKPVCKHTPQLIMRQPIQRPSSNRPDQVP